MPMYWTDDDDTGDDLIAELEAAAFAPLGAYGDVDDLGDDEPIAHEAAEPDTFFNPPTAADRIEAERSRATMLVSCAWCRADLGTKECAPENAGLVSHSICASCAKVFV